MPYWLNGFPSLFRALLPKVIIAWIGTHNNPNQIQMPIQWVRVPAAGSKASSVVADIEREDLILDLQAISRESLGAQAFDKVEIQSREFDLCSKV